ncbi:MAG: hypothetical protein AAF628_31160 [Planctomycetota bacterium]
MNKLVLHRHAITHYVVLGAGLTLTLVGTYLSWSATYALSWPQFAADGTQVDVSWMCISPGVTCVLIGGLILLKLVKGKAD